MTRFLLDSNILSHAIWQPQGRVARRMERGQARICTSIVVAAELRYGAFKRGSRVLSGKIEALLDGMTVLPLESPVDQFYAELRTQLERVGTPISANDLLIGSHALALDCTLVTDNEREFSRIKSLTLENWLR
jgi:tRNA(fMet)-specific endonuclease VapC